MPQPRDGQKAFVKRPKNLSNCVLLLGAFLLIEVNTADERAH
jgi:hypothetical protein